MESLSEYVTRIMKEKNLWPTEVARRSKGAIGDSHVSNVMNGVTTNLTLERLKGLAVGLDVDPVELFKVAARIETQEKGWTVPVLLRAIQKMVALKPAKIKTLKKLLEIE